MNQKFLVTIFMAAFSFKTYGSSVLIKEEEGSNLQVVMTPATTLPPQLKEEKTSNYQLLSNLYTQTGQLYSPAGGRIFLDFSFLISILKKNHLTRLFVKMPKAELVFTGDPSLLEGVEIYISSHHKLITLTGEKEKPKRSVEEVVIGQSTPIPSGQNLISPKPVRTYTKRGVRNLNDVLKSLKSNSLNTLYSEVP